MSQDELAEHLRKISIHANKVQELAEEELMADVDMWANSVESESGEIIKRLETQD